MNLNNISNLLCLLPPPQLVPLSLSGYLVYIYVLTPSEVIHGYFHEIMIPVYDEAIAQNVTGLPETPQQFINVGSHSTSHITSIVVRSMPHILTITIASEEPEGVCCG